MLDQDKLQFHIPADPSELGSHEPTPGPVEALTPIENIYDLDDQTDVAYPQDLATMKEQAESNALGSLEIGLELRPAGPLTAYIANVARPGAINNRHLN